MGNFGTGVAPLPRLDACSGKGKFGFAGAGLGDGPGDDPHDVEDVLSPADG